MISKPYHPLLVFVSDVVGVGLAWWLAYLIRFNFAIPVEFLPAFFVGLGVTLVLQGVLLRAFGLYRGIWVFASLPDLLRIARAVGRRGMGAERPSDGRFPRGQDHHR